jgi:predicted AAA+ superfamily ATPase
VAIDRNRAQKGLYLLSGSSSPDLVKSIAESLSGRIAMLELGPFSLAEAFSQSASPIYQLIATRAGIDALLTAASPRIPLAQVLEYWFNGGYPEPWLSNDDDFRRLWQRNYLDTYLLRDIGSLFPGLNRDRYRQFIQLLANVSGTLLNNAEIARTLGVSEPTVRDWLWIAHGTFIWRHIPAWDRSPHKQLVRHPKGYLRDSGVLHRLLQIPSQDHLASHVVNGRSWEGMIVEQLLRGLESAGYRASPFHYRTRGGAEIDLILQGDFGILPVEIKLSSSSPRRDWTALREFVETHQCAYGIVINNDERPRQLDDRILSIPAAAL